MDPCIRVKQMSKSYGGHLAVDRVNFTISPGEVFGFLGPNGVGKTTTQRILTGLLKPSQGSVWILDHDMARDPLGAKEHIGIVPEVATPYMELSARRNLLLSGEFYGLGGRSLKSRAQELLQEFGLWERSAEPVKNFSKGMKQRLVLAMALLHRPQVLFLDEPTAGLDVESRHLIHEKVKALARQGRIVAMDRPEALKAAFQGSQSVLAAFGRPVETEDFSRFNSIHRVEKQGDKVRLYTSHPGQVIMDVVEFSQQNNLGILSLNTLGPSLEDIFVSLTHGNQEPAGEQES
ncbi:MAG: ABC transporter ATP-binding protein [Thermodesulfobacteriota bacterium]